MDQEQQQRYERARTRVKELKGFYTMQPTSSWSTPGCWLSTFSQAAGGGSSGPS
jgi:hypothetical protein